MNNFLKCACERTAQREKRKLQNPDQNSLLMFKANAAENNNIKLDIWIIPITISATILFT